MRPKHTIETPVGKQKVEIYDWVTGGDKRFLAGIKDESSVHEAMLSRLVVSIDGKTDGILAMLDDMHGKDFDFVLREIQRVAEESSLTEEKKSSS